MIVLAILQGIAEFLPISSSGHLVVVSALLRHLDPSAVTSITDVNIILHLGTLGSIVVFYWRHLWSLLSQHRRLIPIVVLATIPVAISGMYVKTQCEQIMGNSLLAGYMLLVTAGLLLIAQRLPQGTTTFERIGYGQAVAIGLSQAVAILPGVSRSGSTISAGIAAGLTRADAATFSFLIAIPAIGGACFLEIVDLCRGAELTTSITTLAIGAAISFGVGLVSLSVLLRILQRGKLQWFAYWCLAMGISVIIWQTRLRMSAG